MHNDAVSLDYIAVFVKVVQAGSFRQAARALGMPNTTVSAYVARLEKRLGVTLIRRTTRKLYVTPAGQAYFARCLRGLEEIETAEVEVSCAAPEPRGPLRIAATVSIAHTFLPAIVAQYLRAYVNTSIDVMVTNRTVDLLSEGIDLAIRPAEELIDSSLIARRSIAMSGGLWASRAYLAEYGVPESPADLQHHRFLAFKKVGQTIVLSDERERREVRVNVSLAADDQETLRAFAVEGEGVAPLYDFLAAAWAGEGRLVRVLPNWRWFDGKLTLMYPSQPFVPANVRAFIDVAISAATSGATPVQKNHSPHELPKFAANMASASASLAV